MTDVQAQERQSPLPELAPGATASNVRESRLPVWVRCFLVALVPIAVVLAVVLVLQMSGAQAATGGCGGG